mgnify:FL=1
MIAKNYMELPTEGLTRGCMLDEGNAVTVYLDAHEEVRQVPDGNPEEGRVKDETVRVGYAVRCLKPFTEDRAVDAAIQTAFGLRDGEVSRFNADMAMKIAEGSSDENVTAYKGFVKWLRLELAKALGTMDALTAAKEQKIAEIDAYDQSEAVNGFTLNGAVVWLDKATRVGLMNSTNIAKATGSANTTLWLGGERMVVPCDKAIQLLSALEMYALGCFNVTAAHKKAVSELTTLDEVLAYDYTKGYPEQLKMEV